MDNKNIVLHIGYPKSASTFLQDMIFSKSGVIHLKQPGIDPLVTDGAFDPEGYRDVLLNQAKSVSGDQSLGNVIVISQEKMSGLLDGSPKWNPFSMAKRLQSTFPEAKVLIIIRNQFEYILSLYCWRVIQRGIEWKTLDQYMEEYFDKQLKEKVEYHHLIDEYVQLFGGSDNVKVLPVEMLAVQPESFIQQVCSFTGIKNKFECDTTKKINVTNRSRKLVLFDRIANRLAYSMIRPMSLVTGGASLKREQDITQVYIHFKRRFLNKMFIRFCRSSENIAFSQDWVSKITLELTASNQRLAEMIGVNLKELGYPFGENE